MDKKLMHRFIEEVYDGDREAYLRERKDDYCKVQFVWTCWMDALCKNGEISTKKWENATF